MRTRQTRRRFAVTIAVFFVFVLILEAVYYYAVFSYINRLTKVTVASTVNNLLNALNDEISSLKLASTLIAGNDSVQSFLSEEDVKLYYEKSELVSEIVRKAVYPNLSEVSIMTVTADGFFYQFIGSSSAEAMEKIKSLIDTTDAYAVVRLDGGEFFCQITPVYQHEGDALNPIGYIVSLSNMTRMRRILAKPETATGIDTAVFMGDKVLFSSNSLLDGQNISDLYNQYGSVTTAQVTGSNLVAAAVITKEVLDYGQRLFVVISITAIVILSATIAFLYRRLSSKMVSPMLEKTDIMQMGLLKTQISNHFVVNTIICIKSLAEKGESGKAAQASEHLAYLMKSLHESDEEDNVFDQLEYLNRYIEIMNIRHDNKYIADIDADDRLIEYKMLSQILQPIAENALTHGLSSMTGDCLLKITGKLESDRIVFSIYDNGIGMEKSQLKALQDVLDTADDWDYDEYRLSGVALINIQKRIRARYGKEYGITLNGNPGQGLTVTVTLPAIKDSADKNIL